MATAINKPRLGLGKPMPKKSVGPAKRPVKAPMKVMKAR